MRRALVFALVTAALFLIGMTALSPRLLPWWFQPPTPQVVDCTPAVRWAIDHVLISQLAALGTGFVAGLILAIVTRRKTVAVTTTPTPVAPKDPARR